MKEVKRVKNRVFKVQVEKDQLDRAMEGCRSEQINIVSHHAYKPKEATNTRFYLTDRVVVKLVVETTTETIEAILRNEGVRILKEYPGMPNTYLLEVTRTAGRNPIKVANSLVSREEVVFAEPNLIDRFISAYAPVDTLFDRQWHLLSWSGPDLVEDADVSATGAWDITREERSIVGLK